MNRDQLQIPEFIQRYLVRHNGFNWSSHPVTHDCGFKLYRIPQHYSKDFLYQKNYTPELESLLKINFLLCPNCNKPLWNECEFQITLIDLDSKEIFIYSNGETNSWRSSNEFEENGFKINLFKTIDFLKEGLSQKYKIIENKKTKSKKVLRDYPKELNIPEFIYDFFDEKILNIYEILQSNNHKCGYKYILNGQTEEIIFLYRNWYKEDLNTLLNDDYKILCPVCGEILSNDIKYYLLFIDVDSKESYIFNEEIKYRSVNETVLKSNGFQTNYFESVEELKEKLVEKYKGDVQ